MTLKNTTISEIVVNSDRGDTFFESFDHRNEVFSSSWQMRWSQMPTIFACLVLTEALTLSHNRDSGIHREALMKSTEIDTTVKHSGNHVMSAVRSRVNAALKFNPSHSSIHREFAKQIWVNFKQAFRALYRFVVLDPLRNLRNLHGSLKSARIERSNSNERNILKKTNENGYENVKSSPPIFLLELPIAILMPSPSAHENIAEIRVPNANDQISIFSSDITSHHPTFKSLTSISIFKQTVESQYAKFKESNSSKLNNLYFLVILLVIIGGGINMHYLDKGQLQIKLVSHSEKDTDSPQELKGDELSGKTDDDDADADTLTSLVQNGFRNYHDRTEAKESYGLDQNKCSDLDAKNADHPFAELRQEVGEIQYENVPSGSSATEHLTAILAECESYEVMTVFDSLSDSVSTATSTNVSPSSTSDRHVNVKTLTCSSPFDQNGVISYLTSFAGVHHKGKSSVVRAKMSSIFLGSETTILTQSLEHPGLHSFPNYTQNEANSWCAIDLGSGRRLMPTQYCIRHGASSTGNALRSWELRGRERENEEWDVLKAHMNDETLSSTPMSVALWDIDQKKTKKRRNELETEVKVTGDAAKSNLKAYRYFLLLQTAVNSSGNHCLFVGGLELYGVFTEK
jgi:hypothetical protein